MHDVPDEVPAGDKSRELAGHEAPSRGVSGDALRRSTAALQEVSDRELLLAAIHEAAHELLLHHFGGAGIAHVWPNPAPSPEMKAWLGRCVILAEPGQVTFSRGHRKRFGILPKPPVRWRRYVGLAGFVAEQLLLGAKQPWEIMDAYLNAYDFGELSESDLAMIGGQISELDIVRTTRYLHARWPALETAAAHLIQTAADMWADPGANRWAP
jgi:hypothetical protein